MNPPAAIECKSAAGDDAVQMRMKQQFARPRVEHSGHTELHRETIAAERVECFGRGIEEQVVDHLRICVRERSKIVGQREDDVEVSRR